MGPYSSSSVPGRCPAAPHIPRLALAGFLTPATRTETPDTSYEPTVYDDVRVHAYGCRRVSALQAPSRLVYVHDARHTRPRPLLPHIHSLRHSLEPHTLATPSDVPRPYPYPTPCTPPCAHPTVTTHDSSLLSDYSSKAPHSPISPVCGQARRLAPRDHRGDYRYPSALYQPSGLDGEIRRP